MAKNPRLDQLRAEVAIRAQAASRKVSRLKANGVLVAGTEYDPRRPTARTTRYTERQLRSYLNELNTFVSRQTRFVGLSEGAPVPAAEWFRATKTAREYNAIVDAHRNAFKDVFVPQKGQTIEDFDHDMRSKSYAAGRASHKPLDYKELVPERIASAEALKEIENGLRKKLEPGYLEGRISAAREELSKMLDVIGAHKLQPLADELSDYQFNVLWSELDLADSVSGMYETVKNHNVAFFQTMDEKFDDVKEMMEWARDKLEDRPL